MYTELYIHIYIYMFIYIHKIKRLDNAWHVARCNCLNSTDRLLIGRNSRHLHAAVPATPYRRYFAKGVILTPSAQRIQTTEQLLDQSRSKMSVTPVDLQANPWQQVNLHWSLLSRTLQNQLGSRERQGSTESESATLGSAGLAAQMQDNAGDVDGFGILRLHCRFHHFYSCIVIYFPSHPFQSSSGPRWSHRAPCKDWGARSTWVCEGQEEILRPGIKSLEYHA